MPHDDRIGELVHVILETDRTPEEVCADTPELLPEVRNRLQKLQAVADQIDLLFPPSGARTETFHSPLGKAEAALPSIPEYEVQRVLGRGGMGIVFKALHLKLNRHVALKMLLSGSYASQQEHTRFSREAEAVAALKHPNVVQVYDFGEVNGNLYYTMEYVGGGSLAEKLDGTPQPARESAKMLSALAKAVQSAHDLGIVHRDLKPANILLTDAETPKISDFGLARRLDRDSGLTHTGDRIGTPSYMAPEQMQGSSNSAGPAVDVFALGAILYEMLTGHPPFRGKTLSDTERKLATEQPTPPSKFNAKVPRDLETICLKCLEKEPKARYSSAGALAADLDRFLQHEPIHARPIPLGERGVRWIRRNPLPAAFAASLIVVVGLLASQAMEEWASLSAQRAEKSRLTARLESGIQLVQSGRFSEAAAILEKLGDGGFEELRQGIDRALSDLRLARQLEAISAKRATVLNARDDSWQPNTKAAAEYESLFAGDGIGKRSEDPAVVAKRIRASDINEPLAAALDDWAVCETEPRRHWVLEVARHADANPSDWSTQFRTLATWNDHATLTRLAETAQAANPSVQQLRALGDRLATAGLDAIAFRRKVEEQYVDSFLANLTLADALRATDPTEAIRYYQAALAIRPQSATAHNNLAVALANLDRSGEAVAHYEQSLQIDPSFAAVHYNLAWELSKMRPQDAIEQLQKGIELNPKLASAHRLLGELYLREERYADAEAALKRCLELLKLDDAKRSQVLELLRQCEAASPAKAEASR